MLTEWHAESLAGMTAATRDMSPAVCNIYDRLLDARAALQALCGRPHTASDLQPLQAPLLLSGSAAFRLSAALCNAGCMTT